MAVLDAKKTLKNLYNKGFITAEGRCVDHYHLAFVYDDVVILRTKISHNTDDLGDFLIAQMSKQCNLKKNDFLDLARCPLSQENYEEKLRKSSLIP